MFVVEACENSNHHPQQTGGKCPLENCAAAGCFSAAVDPVNRRETGRRPMEGPQHFRGSSEKLAGASLVAAALGAFVVPLGTMVAVVALFADITGELPALGWALLAATISAVPAWWWLRRQGCPRRTNVSGIVDERT